MRTEKGLQRRNVHLDFDKEVWSTHCCYAAMKNSIGKFVETTKQWHRQINCKQSVHVRINFYINVQSHGRTHAHTNVFTLPDVEKWVDMAKVNWKEQKTPHAHTSARAHKKNYEKLLNTTYIFASIWMHFILLWRIFTFLHVRSYVHQFFLMHVLFYLTSHIFPSKPSLESVSSLSLSNRQSAAMKSKRITKFIRNTFART